MALVAQRGALSLVSDAQLREIDTLLLLDPDDHERHRASAVKAGQTHSRVVALPSLAAEGAAEQAMLLTLALSRRLLAGYSAVVGGTWALMPLGPVLAGKTLGIIGLGRGGQALARLALGFNMRVVFHDVADRTEAVARLGVVQRRLDQLLRESDIVSLHLPANSDTLRLIGAPELAAMKPTSLLINVADGRLIDEGALIKALRLREISGAGLDAFAYEPLPPDSPLIGLENVVLTPRTARMDFDEERHAWLRQIVDILMADA